MCSVDDAMPEASKDAIRDAINLDCELEQPIS